MIDLASILVVANLIVIVGGVIGGWFVLRSSIAKAESEVQARVREALRDENELLRARVARIEHENKRLDSLIQLLILMLKKTHQIDIDINGEIITMRSSNGVHTSRIPRNS